MPSVFVVVVVVVVVVLLLLPSLRVITLFDKDKNLAIDFYEYAAFFEFTFMLQQAFMTADRYVAVFDVFVFLVLLLFHYNQAIDRAFLILVRFGLL